MLATVFLNLILEVTSGITLFLHDSILVRVTGASLAHAQRRVFIQELENLAHGSHLRECLPQESRQMNTLNRYVTIIQN